MTSFMALDGVTSFLRLKKALQVHVNVCGVVFVLAGVFQCNGGKLEEKLKTSNVFSSFIVC